MKHPIAAVGTVPGLKETLLAFIRELRDTRCQAITDELATVNFDDEITVTVELLASGGLNAIPRISVSKSGEVVKRDTLPAIEEVTTAGEEINLESGTVHVTEDTTQHKTTQYTVNGTGGSDRVETDQTIEAG